MLRDYTNQDISQEYDSRSIQNRSGVVL